MNYSDYRFTLDIQLQQAQVSVPATLNDTARRLCIGLTDGRKPYIIADGCTAAFAAKKPDGFALYNQCTIENNTVIYEFTPQTASVAGTCECEIRLYNEVGKQLTSPRFLLVVDEQAIDDDDIIDSFTEVTMLNQIISNETERINAENTRISNETERKTAENARINSESTRINNENTRIANEDERNIGEYGSYDYHWDNDKWCIVDGNGNPVPDNEINGRVGAENARVRAETLRVEAETKRVKAENNRASAENTRVANENARVEAETARDSAEFNRNTYEQARQWNESKREEAETARVSAENTRATNEKNRLLQAYPIGSIYMSVNSTSPASIFGGTWVQLKDRFLIGAGGSYSINGTGGATSVSLGYNNMPTSLLRAAKNYKTTAVSVNSAGWGSSSIAASIYTSTTVDSADDLGDTSYTGKTNVSTMPPYLAVYMWKRTA